MCDYDNAIFRLATAQEAEPEDYTGEDGLLYCGSCRQPKEAYFPEGKTFFGRDRHPKECDCQRKRRETLESQSHRLNDQIAAKEKELTRITRYKQSLYQDWKDGEITQQEYREMKADYERQAAELTDLLARLTAERKELSNGVDQQHPALVAFAKYQNIEKLTREILIELVDHIKVYENGNISVHFKFADEFRRIAEYIEINTTDTAEAG